MSLAAPNYYTLTSQYVQNGFRFAASKDDSVIDKHLVKNTHDDNTGGSGCMNVSEISSLQ